MAWIHGTRTYRDAVIEVEEVKSPSALKGGPKQSLGWRARIVLAGVTITTNELWPTREDSQDVVINQLNDWIETSDRNHPTRSPHDRRDLTDDVLMPLSAEEMIEMEAEIEERYADEIERFYFRSTDGTLDAEIPF